MILRHPSANLLLRICVGSAAIASTMIGLGGCAVAEDAARWIVGAPTRSEIESAKKQALSQEEAIEEMRTHLQRAEQRIADAERMRKSVEDRKGQLRTLYGAMAQQASTLEGPAADALIASMDTIRIQLRMADEAASKAEEISAGYRSRLAELEGEQKRAERLLEDALVQLEAYDAETAEAVERAVGGAERIGAIVQEFGLPGARQATEQVTGLARFGLEGLLGAGAAGSVWYARRRKKQEERERQRTQRERERRLLLTRIVQVNEEFGLIKDDKQLRDAAKNVAGPDAVRELKLARATAVDRPNIMAEEEAAAA